MKTLKGDARSLLIGVTGGIATGKSVVAAMLRIDPGAQRSIDLMAELEAQVAEIDAEIVRLSE